MIRNEMTVHTNEKKTYSQKEQTQVQLTIELVLALDHCW